MDPARMGFPKVYVGDYIDAHYVCVRLPICAAVVLRQAKLHTKVGGSWVSVYSKFRRSEVLLIKCRRIR